MTVVATKITCSSSSVKRQIGRASRRLTFSGNYATGGEAITASTFGLRRITRLIPHAGVASSSDVATSIPIGWNTATSKLLFYEGSAAGTALSEKTNAEAYPTGCFIDVTVFGSR
jgi:hypothetical protein